MLQTVAIIGSFKQHYDHVRRVWRAFTDLGLEVTSPKGTPIIQDGIPFVRFESDEQKWSDPMVQTVALHRILRSDFVYVVAPEGYVGRTTCYEIGRIIQARRPLYFSERPDDLPISIPDSHIVEPVKISELFLQKRFDPQPLYINPDDEHQVCERRLLLGQYLEDGEFYK